MDWLPFLGEISNHFCLYYVVSLIMNTSILEMRILVEEMLLLTEGRPVTNVRRGIFLGLSVPDDCRVDHQLTE